MSHKFSGETIFSLTCSKCGNWWSYAHVSRKYDFKLPKALERMYCPHCGFNDSVERHNDWGRGEYQWSQNYPA